MPFNQPFAAVTGPSLTASPALMAASHDLAWIGAASSDQRLLVWAEGISEAQITSEKNRRNLSALAFSHDGVLAASSDGQGKLNIWDVEAGIVLDTLDVPAGVSSLTFSFDGDLLAVTSGDGIQLWQTGDWSLLDSFSGTAAAFSPDGDFLAAAARDDNEEVVFLRQIGRESTSVAQRIAVSGNALAFSPDGELLAVSGKTLTILRVSDGKLLLELDPPLPFGKPFFSPDGTYLALSHWDGTSQFVGNTITRRGAWHAPKRISALKLSKCFYTWTATLPSHPLKSLTTHTIQTTHSATMITAPNQFLGFPSHGSASACARHSSITSTGIILIASVIPNGTRIRSSR